MLNDLRYAIRILRKNPGFTAPAVLTLALGIGANTAIFSLLDQVLLELLPVRNPRELVLLTARGDHYGNNFGGNSLSYPMYQDFRDHADLKARIFRGLMCRFATAISLNFEGQTDRAAGELVSGNYFQVLGVGAALGRTLTPDDDRTPGAHPVVVLSYDFWKTRFASDRAIVGKTILVNGLNMTVLGVSEPGFSGVELGFSSQVFIPMMMQHRVFPDPPGLSYLKDRRSRWVNVFGRLRPGVPTAQAKAALGTVFHQILEMEVREAAFRNASPYSREQFLRMIMDILPGSQGRSFLRQQLQRPLWTLMVIVIVVLLAACSNMAGLLIARATARQKEIAVRLALGASRFQLIRQLLLESLLLSCVAGVAGLILAIWTGPLLLSFLPQNDFPSNLSTTPNLRVLTFALVISVVSGILFGLLPAIRSTRPALVSSLKDQAGTLIGGGHVRLRKALVVAQVSLSLLLLVAAGLFVRSLRNLKATGPGFPAERLTGFNLDPSQNGYSPERCKLFYRELVRNLEALPGVRSAALASVRILEGNEWDSTVTVEGYEPKPGEDMSPYFNGISPGYFLTMGIPLIAGRDFTLQDTKTVPHEFGSWTVDVPTTVIVNEKLVRHYFGDKNPIGRHLGFGNDRGTKLHMEIIGVVKDAKYTSLRDEVPRQAFVPYLAFPFIRGMTGYVRTSAEPTQVFAEIRAEVRKLDPNVPVFAMRTLEAQIDRSLRNERLVASLSALFSLLAVLLSMIGLYGVMAYLVGFRTREIGIRMALGARSGHVLNMILGQGLRLVLIGLVIGLVAALSLTRILSSLLFGVTAFDPVTFVGVAILLLAISLLACYLPARHAARVDPMVALRYE
jgi:predicted permease